MMSEVAVQPAQGRQRGGFADIAISSIIESFVPEWTRGEKVDAGESHRGPAAESSPQAGFLPSAQTHPLVLQHARVHQAQQQNEEDSVQQAQQQEEDDVPARPVVEVQGVIPDWLGQSLAGSFLTNLPGVAISSVAWSPANEDAGPRVRPLALPAPAEQGQMAGDVADAHRRAAAGQRGVRTTVDVTPSSTAAGGGDAKGCKGRVSLSVASAKESTKGGALMAMLQSGFNRRLNGQDVSFLSKAANGAITRSLRPCARTSAGAAGLQVALLSEGALENELFRRIIVLAQAGVVTSNDQELARALQDMLDREVEEEASLRVCRQLEQEDADRLVALRLNTEEQNSQEQDHLFAVRLHQNTQHPDRESAGGTGVGVMESMMQQEQDRAYAIQLQQELVVNNSTSGPRPRRSRCS